jgi:hypothetical protein
VTCGFGLLFERDWGFAMSACDGREQRNQDRKNADSISMKKTFEAAVHVTRFGTILNGVYARDIVRITGIIIW